MIKMFCVAAGELGGLTKKKTHSGSEFAGRIRMRDVFFVAFAVGN